MPRRTLVALLAITLSVFTARADDLQSLQGKWRIESMEAGGKPVESEELLSQELTINGATYETLTRDKKDAGTLALNETTTPKQLDATDTEGDDAGKVIKAIYELEGDTLRVCLSFENGARPTAMKTQEGSPWLLVIYRRVK